MSALTEALARLHRDMGQIDGETLRYQHGPSARTTVEPLEAAILAAEEEREALLAALEFVVDPATGHYHAENTRKRETERRRRQIKAGILQTTCGRAQQCRCKGCRRDRARAENRRRA